MRRLLLLTALVFSCQPLPAVLPPDAPGVGDAAAASDIFDRACANLIALHCADGTTQPPENTCANVMRHAETSHLTQTRPDCVAQAPSVAAVRNCGRYCARLLP